MNQLQTYPSKYKNLDECTYKILELETSCNKTIEEYKRKLDEVIRESEENEQNQIKKTEDQIWILR